MTFAQIAVSIGVISFSAFFVAELKFQGWTASSISLLLGLATLFELIRVYFGWISDRVHRSRLFIAFGALLAVIGIFGVPRALMLNSIGLVFLCLVLFNIGSSITSSLIDTHLTSISTTLQRNRIAGYIQFSRTFGFVIGAVIGGIFYSKVDSLESFVQFMDIIAIIVACFYFISILFIYDQDRIDGLNDHENMFGIRLAISSIWTDPRIIQCFLLLLFYPFALFMQDFILEPFAIEQLNYTRDQIGSITQATSMIILLGIPMGLLLSNRISRFPTFLLGQGLVIAGLLGIIRSSHSNPDLFLPTLLIFSLGTGIISAPTFAYLLDNASNLPFTATIIALFGVMTTISRALSNIFTGIVLHVTTMVFSVSDISISYTSVFVIELVFAILMIFPVRNMAQFKLQGNI